MGGIIIILVILAMLIPELLLIVIVILAMFFEFILKLCGKSFEDGKSPMDRLDDAFKKDPKDDDIS